VLIKDRIKEFKRVPASELRANPKNWREHPAAQREVMEGVLRDVGFAGALPVYETEEGLTIIDGHLRADIANDQDVPVLVLDVTEAEANLLLATLDPVGEMAKGNQATLDDLLVGIETNEGAVQKMLDSMTSSGKPKPKKGLKDIERNPPAMTWVLLGIPTEQYGEIAGLVERVTLYPDSIVETGIASADDDDKDG
jgi:hypothetical protein